MWLPKTWQALVFVVDLVFDVVIVNTFRNLRTSRHSGGGGGGGGGGGWGGGGGGGEIVYWVCGKCDATHSKPSPVLNLKLYGEIAD